MLNVVFKWLVGYAERHAARAHDAELVLCEHNPGIVVIDLGCGDGTFTARAGKKVETAKLIGIDIAPESVAALLEKGIEAKQADLNQRLPIDDESVDVVIASQIIEHVNDTDMFVKEIYRVLKPGGYVIVATPNLAGLYNIAFLLVGKQPPVTSVSDVRFSDSAWNRAIVSTCKPLEIPLHRRVFTRGALKSMLRFYGFRCEKVVMSGFPPLPWFAADLACYLLPIYAWNIIIKARKPG